MDDADMTLNYSSGAVILDNDVFLDAYVVLVDSNQSPILLTSINVETNNIKFNFSTSTDQNIFTINVPNNVNYPFEVRGFNYYSSYGFMFGEGCLKLRSLGQRIYNCNIPLLQSLVIYRSFIGVDSIRGSHNNSVSINGSIRLLPGYNCDIFVSSDSIEFSAGLGYGAGRTCKKLTDGISVDNALLWFNGVNASEDGNVGLSVGDGFVIENLNNQNTVVIKPGFGLETFGCMDK